MTGKKRLVLQRWGFILPLLVAVLPTLASLIAAKYLIPAEDYHTPPPPAKRGTNAPAPSTSPTSHNAAPPH